MSQTILRRWYPILLAVVGAAWSPDASAQGTPAPAEPQVAPASDEAVKALAGFQIPAGWKANLFASEPLVANPVAFHIDPQGRVYVCESFRQEQGIEDNRKHPDWLEDDQAAQTVADRLAYLRKHLGDKVREYEKQDDRIRLLSDRDGDGQADDSRVFANGFNQIVAGTGAGLVTLGNDVFYTCIPDLWRLRDDDGDGMVDRRDSLLAGFGVRFAFRGHDLHGLVVGPDGKIYFSVGDRGYNVVADGRRWANPECGAVFRCSPDGSDFEVVAYGLRNPQELAFDDHGNLFTCDNNSDSGDQARWTVIAEGGDTGWRMSYQYLPDRGPFNREKIWHPFHADSPAHIVPPIANLSSGPSGLAYYPGTGLSDHFRGRFFLCDFRGAAAGSSVRTFRVESAGAFYRISDAEETLKNILATDVDFGPDGAVYVSDWVNGWTGLGKGRIYRFVSTAHASDPLVAEVRALLAAPFEMRSAAELGRLLFHADRRVRQKAQFALVSKRAVESLADAARGGHGTPLIGRLHGLWGLGQLASIAECRDASVATIASLTSDSEPEVRGQAARLVGEARHGGAFPQLVAALRDDNLRVRYFAAQSLGKLQRTAAIEPLASLLAENQDADPMLRHAASVALARIAGWKLWRQPNGAPAPRSAAEQAALAEVVAAGKHPSPSVRTGVVVALRKIAAPQVAEFLQDADPRPVLEATRAIYDEPIPDALPQLADLITRPDLPDPVVRRVLNAQFRLGEPSNAAALALFATRADVDEARRLEALRLLDNWSTPPTRDGVLNHYRPLAPRDEQVAKDAFHAALPKLLARQDKVGLEAVKLAARFGLQEIGPVLRALIANAEAAPLSRADALRALDSIDSAGARPIVLTAIDDPQPLVRSAAREVLATREPTRAIPLLAQALSSGERVERQSAARALATLRDPNVVATLAVALEKTLAGQFPADTRLDLLEAALARKHQQLDELVARIESARPKDDPLAPYLDTLEGGDAESGRRIFFERTQVSCVRCHKIDERGGDVGPDLSKIGVDKMRQYLLEAVVMPNRAIAKNFETALIITDDGKVHSGIVKSDDAQSLKLMTAEGKLLTLDKSTIDERREGKSAMPEDLVKQLSRRDLRDLVEFLAQRRGSAP